MHKIGILIRKEWSEVFKNRLVLGTVGFMPLMLTAMPLVLLRVMGGAGGLGDVGTSDMPASFARLCEGLSGAECAQYFIVTEFLLLYMLMPLMIPVTIAAYSIVGEKSTRTLEPLLATPITTVELLAGKGLAAALPAVAATWLSFGVFALGARLLGVGPGLLAKLVDPMWLIAIFIVGPLLAVASVSFAVMISSRVNEPRVAEQLAGLVVLPLLALFFGQVSGLILLNSALVLWMALGLLVLDAGLLAFAVQLFQRESILTRWK
ncbi:MAG: ABC transporter permease subunit [Anaerolineales bacterium]|nr:ABC transporter permease subunit [Anaerolineales bacterium]